MAFCYDHTITPANLGSPAADVTDFVFKIFIANMNADFVAALRSDGMDIRVSADGGSTQLDKDLVGFVQFPAAGYIAFRSTMDKTNNMVFRISGDGSTSYANANTTYRTAYKMEIPCNEASGDLADRTQYNNHMHANGTVTYAQTGLYGPACGLDATTEKFYAADSASLSALTTKTIRVWCKPAANQTAGKDGLSKWLAAGSQYEWSFENAFNHQYNRDNSVPAYKEDYQNPVGTYLTAAIHQSVIRTPNTGVVSSIWRDGAAVALTHVTSGAFVAVEDTTATVVLGYNVDLIGSALVGIYNHISILGEETSDSEEIANYTMIINSATLGSKSATTFPATGSRLVGDSVLVGDSALVGFGAHIN